MPFPSLTQNHFTEFLNWQKNFYYCHLALIEMTFRYSVNLSLSGIHRNIMESRTTETYGHCFCAPKKENRNDLRSLERRSGRTTSSARSLRISTTLCYTYEILPRACPLRFRKAPMKQKILSFEPEIRLKT